MKLGNLEGRIVVTLSTSGQGWYRGLEPSHE